MNATQSAAGTLTTDQINLILALLYEEWQKCQEMAHSLKEIKSLPDVDVDRQVEWWAERAESAKAAHDAFESIGPGRSASIASLTPTDDLEDFEARR